MSSGARHCQTQVRPSSCRTAPLRKRRRKPKNGAGRIYHRPGAKLYVPATAQTWIQSKTCSRLFTRRWISRLAELSCLAGRALKAARDTLKLLFWRSWRQECSKDAWLYCHEKGPYRKINGRISAFLVALKREGNQCPDNFVTPCSMKWISNLNWKILNEWNHI